MGRDSPNRSRRSVPLIAALVALPALVVLVTAYIRFIVVPQERAVAETTWTGLVRTTAVHWQIALDSWLDWLHGEAKAIAGQPALALALRKPGSDLSETGKLLELVRTEHRLSRVVLLDAKGVRLINAVAGEEMAPVAVEPVNFILSSKKPTRWVSQRSDGEAVISWGVPIMLEHPDEMAGILVVEADLWHSLLSRLDCAWGTSASIDCAVVYREGTRHLRLGRPGAGPASAKTPASGATPALEFAVFEKPKGNSFVGIFPVAGARESLIAAYRLEDPSFAVSVSVEREEVWRGSAEMIRKRALASWFVVLCALITGLALLRVQHVSHEHELVLKDSRFAAVLAEANDVILFISLDGKILDANRRAETIYGRSRDELRKLTVADLRTPETGAAAVSILQKASSKGSLVWETTHRDKDGNVIPFEASGRLVREGETEFILAILRDISERKKAEQAVEAAQAEIRKLSLAVEQSPVGVLITSREGQIEYVNRRFCEMTGYSREEAIGKNPRILRSGAQEPRVYRELWQSILAGREWRGELLNRKKSGELYWESMLIAPIVEARVIRHFVAIKEDITEKRNAEEALRSSQSQLLHAQKMEAVGRLAGGVAHDFNNLLSVILGYAELAEDSLGESHPVRRQIQEIRKAGQRAANLTRQLLSFSRKQVHEPHIIDLNQIVRETKKMLTRLIGEDVELDARLEASPAAILADPGQIEQVLLNLAVNARDAMPLGGKVTIRSGNEEIGPARAGVLGLGKPGPFVVLHVSDTGHGIPAEIQSKVFEPFFTTKEPGKGTGLGLSTVYGIVKQSGGGITLQSGNGSGTTFSLYFPQSELPAAGVAVAEPAISLEGKGERVLLVEDDSTLRGMTAEMLRSRGYEVLAAADPDEAAGLAERHHDGIQILLADLVMPGGGGKLLAEKLLRANPGLRVLLVSGYSADSAVVESALESGMAFLEKPYTAATLLTRVRELLDGRSGS